MSLRPGSRRRASARPSSRRSWSTIPGACSPSKSSSQRKATAMNLRYAHIAVLAGTQYQELELWYPILRLGEAGANVVVVAPSADQVYASKLGYPVAADLGAGAADPRPLERIALHDALGPA